MSRTTRVAIALGSNLGDRQAHIAFARTRLCGFITDLQMSPTHETVPVGAVEPQPLFLNAVIVGDSTLTAARLLEELLAIEDARGRERPFQGAARTLDLDLVLFGDAVIDEPSLTVPHPRFRERAFVLEPLVEVAPMLRDPLTGLTMAELLARLRPAPTARRP